MSLAPGTRLGPHEITGAIGAGGMGEVFRARDTRLNRDVALKVLPAAFAQDAERVLRFKREAQILASLNHPNIAGIFGLEESERTLALAMEYVPGEDLAQRLARGAIAFDEAVAIARQIAEALEEAHEHGVVHRDLKPANVKLAPDGKVKVLDFGLAKALEVDASGNGSQEQSHSPTLTHRGTATGIILGTAAYMSPEQARGRSVDKRADIWSFGVVLYEMLTGRRLFAGETVSDTLAAVLKTDPDWSALPQQAPASVRTLLRRCLEREPKRRLRDIGEARLALDGASEAAPAAPMAGLPAPGRRAPRALVAPLSLVALASAGLGWYLPRLRPAAAPVVTRLAIPLPPGQFLAGNSGPAITRDGRTLAYVARDASGVSQLYLRPLDRFESSVVPDSEGAQQPFFSPDGGRVGFFAKGKLKTTAVAGGRPAAIADASYQPFGGTWGEDDTIVFVPTLMSGLLRVPAGGGKPQALTKPDGASAGYAHAFPQVLPGGRLLFTIWGGRNLESSDAAVLPPGGSKWQLSSQSSLRVWPSSYLSSGHLLISGPRGVSAVPFDPARPQATIAPTPVVEDVYSSPNLNFSWISASETGTLVYVPGDPSLATLAWADRSGGVTPLSGKPSRFLDQAISPDGTRIVLFVDGSLWTMDLRRGTRSRLTAVDGGVRRFANWSRDGTRIFFASNESGEWEMYSVPSAGGRATQLLARPGMQMPLSEAPDGTLLFGERFTGAGSDLLLLAPGGQVSTFVASGFANVGGQFSPDGTLIAYTSDETGREEVYVRPVAKPDQVIAVSTEGGRGPKWSADGNEIVYRRGDAFVSAGVSAKGALSVGDSRTLFELRTGAPTNTQYAGYDVSPDGRRFLVALPDPSAIPTRINVVQNWFHELKAKVPTR